MLCPAFHLFLKPMPKFLTILMKNLEKFPSVHKSRYSTETALLRVVNDMLVCTEDGNLSLLTIIDLCAVFDVTDHTI